MHHNYSQLTSKIFLILSLLIIQTVLKNSTQQFPKILWKYWQSGIQQYSLAQVFHQQHTKILQNSGWQIRMLNKTTVYQYLKQIPEYQEGQIDVLKFQSVQHKADYIRVMILGFYGGVWIDQSAIFVENFEWLLFQNLRNNPDVLNKYGQQPQVLFFTYPQYGSKTIYQNPQTNLSYQISPGYQIWFIAAKPNSTFLKLFLSQLKKGIQNNMHSYIEDPKYLLPLIRSQNVQLDQLQNNYYLGSLQLIQYLLQKKQNQLDQKAIINSNNSNNNNNNNSNQRELAVWFYKIWHIKSEKGPFAVLNRWKVWKPQQTDIIARYSMQELKNYFNLTIRYFVKIIGSDRTILQLYYYGIDRGNSYEDKINKIKQLNINYVQKFFCPEMYSIYTPSILYQYLIKNSSHKFSTTIIDTNYNSLILQCSQLRKFVQQIKTQPILKTNIDTNFIINSKNNVNANENVNDNNNKNNAMYQNQRLDGGTLQEFLKREKSLMEKQDKLKNQKEIIYKLKIQIEKYKKQLQQRESKQLQANKPKLPVSVPISTPIPTPEPQKQQKPHQSSIKKPQTPQVQQQTSNNKQTATVNPNSNLTPDQISRYNLPQLSISEYTNLSSEQLNFILLTIIALLLLFIIVIILMCKCKNVKNNKSSSNYIRKNRGIDLVQEQIPDSQRLDK